jgi:hypothetical protein
VKGNPRTSSDYLNGYSREYTASYYARNKMIGGSGCSRKIYISLVSGDYKQTHPTSLNREAKGIYILFKTDG